MKYIAVLLMLSLAVLAGCVSSTNQKYSDPKFSFNYPDNFRIIPVGEKPVFTEQTEPQENIASLWPVAEDQVNILVKKELKTKTELERVSSIKVNDVQTYHRLVDQIAKQALANYTEISSKNISVSGITGIDSVIEFDNSGNKIKSRSVVIFFNDNPYVLEYSSVAEMFEKYQKEFEAIVGSFKVR